MKKSFLAMAMLTLLLGCNDPKAFDVEDRAYELAEASFDYGYTCCEANIPREEARKELKQILHKTNKQGGNK